PHKRFELPHLTVEILASPEIGAKFDLTLYAEEQVAGIRFDLVYNADLFGPARMAALLDQFRQLLEQVAARPEQSIARFSLVTPSAHACLPDPSAPLDAAWQEPIHAALARATRLAPDRLALVGPRERWTYAELEARSNQLAHYLIGRGVRPQE